MTRYIDADKFLKEQEDRCGGMVLVGNCSLNNNYLVYELEKCKTEDVQPVVHGKWGERYFCGSGYMYVCSNCGYDSEETNYCAKCGAKMR